MANALVALQAQGPDFANEFNKGADAAQGRQMNALAMQGAQEEMGRKQAEFLMQTLGSVGMGTLGGDINGTPDPEKWAQGMDYLDSLGIGIDTAPYRNNPQLAKTLVDASLSTWERIQKASDDREFEQSLREFDFRMMDANRKFSLMQQQEARLSQPEPGFRPLSPEEVQQLGLPAGAYQIGGDGKISSIGGGGVTVKNIGSIPPGYRVQYDNAGNPVAMEPIEGSPAANEAAAAESAAESKEEQQKTWNAIVNQDIGRAIALIEKGGVRLPVTGFGSEWAASIGGTEAANVKGLIDTVKANAGFDRLQAMRDSSPTGGALGQVSERELAFLQSTIGNLEQAQSKDQIVFNLKRLQSIYRNLLDGKRTYDGLLDDAQSSVNWGIPPGVTEEDVAYTMRLHGLTREQVLRRLNLRGN